MEGLTASVLLSLIGYVEMYSKGAPPGVCGTMTPKHNVPVQTGPSPYTLTLSKQTYSAGDQIQVTLSGSSSFKGFLIKPIKAANMSQTGLNIPDITPKGTSELNALLMDPAMSTVGSLTSDAPTANNCQMASLTHTDNSTKQSVTFTWTAPSTDQGPVAFRYTVVQSKDVFWVNMTSDQITYYESSSSQLTYSFLVMIISFLSRFLSQ